MKNFIAVVIVFTFFLFLSELSFAKPVAEKDGAYSATAMAAVEDNIAMGFFDGKIRIYDPSSSKLVTELREHVKPVDCLASDLLGKYILSAAGDGKVVLWDASSGKPIHKKFSPGTSFASCAIDPGGKYSFAGAGASVSVWNNETWENTAIWEGIKDGVYSIAVHYNGKIAAVGGKNGKINLYSVPEGKLIKTLQAGSGVVIALAFAPKSDLLISGGYDNTARVFNTATGKLIKELSAHSDTVRGVGAPDGGRYFVTAGDDGNVFLWDIQTGKIDNYLKGGASVVSIAVDASLRFIAAGVGKPFEADRFVKIWFPADRFQSRDVFAFQDAFVTISSSGYVDGSGDFPRRVSIYEGGKRLPYADGASKYNKPERMKINLGKGFMP